MEMKSNNGCPFCQEDVINIVQSVLPAMKGLQIECENCGARGPVYETEEEAIAGWELGIEGLEGRKRRI
jgi:Lar family restriction alleviation protein